MRHLKIQEKYTQDLLHVAEALYPGPSPPSKLSNYRKYLPTLPQVILPKPPTHPLSPQEVCGKPPVGSTPPSRFWEFGQGVDCYLLLQLKKYHTPYRECLMDYMHTTYGKKGRSMK